MIGPWVNFLLWINEAVFGLEAVCYGLLELLGKVFLEKLKPETKFLDNSEYEGCIVYYSENIDICYFIFVH